jgi:hypothetical protein
MHRLLYARLKSFYGCVPRLPLPPLRWRTLINLILDGGYQREPFDEVTLFITTGGKTRALWLDAWQVTYWAPVRDLANSDQNAAIERGLRQADIFLRICTANTPRSYWMTMEQTAFHSAQAEEYRQTGHLSHKVINLIMDKQYQRLPFVLC